MQPSDRSGGRRWSQGHAGLLLASAVILFAISFAIVALLIAIASLAEEFDGSKFAAISLGLVVPFTTFFVPALVAARAYRERNRPD